MKPGHILAASIAGVVGLLTTFVIGNILVFPLMGSWVGRTVVLGPLSIGLLLLISAPSSSLRSGK